MKEEVEGAFYRPLSIRQNIVGVSEEAKQRVRERQVEGIRWLV